MLQVTRSIFSTLCCSTVRLSSGRKGLSGGKARNTGWFSASVRRVPERALASWFHWVT
ncbi:hypothetical protein D3C86_2062460 [compost metagenome]